MDFILSLPYFIQGIFISIFYCLTVAFFFYLAVRLANPHWRDLNNFGPLEWMLSITSSLLAINLLADLAQNYFSRGKFGGLSIGIGMILIFINNIIFVVKILGIISLILFYIWRVMGNFQCGECKGRTMVRDLGILVFLILMVLLYLADPNGLHLLGYWNRLGIIPVNK